MVRRLIVAAAVAVASLGANADYIYWNFKNADGSYAGSSLAQSLYVFVTGESEEDALKKPGSVSLAGYKRDVGNLTYTVQSKSEALSKISSILADGSTTADLGNLSFAGTAKSTHTSVYSSPYTAVGAASFTAFAVVFDAKDISKAKNYMILEDYSVLETDGSSVKTTYANAGEAIKSAADGRTWKTIVWGDKANGSSTASGAGTKWDPIATIPEPTSGVMLLLGVAALALKRKRAA